MTNPPIKFVAAVALAAMLACASIIWFMARRSDQKRKAEEAEALASAAEERGDCLAAGGRWIVSYTNLMVVQGYRCSIGGGELP